MKSLRRLVILILVTALLVWNGNSLRKDRRADKSTELIKESLPPSMQVTSIALGPMKGLLVDVLWWRAERLQENKEFFEAMQLAEWMTSLQPTYPSVWSYQGFNMAFNISHNFSSTEERWRWILAGVELMRDRGMTYIPDWDQNRDLRFEIVNIFARKLQGVSDVSARQLQNLWTLETLDYFDSGDRKEIVDLAAAPRNSQELMKVPEVKELARSLKKTDVEFLKMIDSAPPNEKNFKPKTKANKKYNDTIRLMIRYYQRQKIEKGLKLDMDRVLKADNKFGPLDWRTHEAQIIYWGMEDDFEDYSLKGVNYSHFIREAMISSFFNGRVVFSEKADYFFRSHNLEMLPRVHDYFDFLLFDALKEGTPQWKRVDDLHKDFIERAIVICYSYNQAKASKELFKIYRNDYMKDKKTTFEQFLIAGFATSLKVANKRAKSSFIESVINDALQNAFRGEWDRYYGLLKKAKLIHTLHQLQNKDVEARHLPPFKDILKSARKAFMEKSGKSNEDLSNMDEKSEPFKDPKQISIGGSH
jgi:hypothetical protein